MIVLSASGLVAEDAVVAVSVVVMWSVVAVAVLWHVVVAAVVPSTRSMLLSLLCAAVTQSDLVDLVVVHVPSSSLGVLHHVSSSFLAFPSFSASDAIRTCSVAHLIAVAQCPTDCHLQHQ